MDAIKRRQEQQEWTEERAQLLKTIMAHEDKEKRAQKRLKVLQKMVVEQQKLLERYQKALVASGCAVPPGYEVIHAKKRPLEAVDGKENMQEEVAPTNSPALLARGFKRHSVSGGDKPPAPVSDGPTSSKRRQTLSGDQELRAVEDKRGKSDAVNSWTSRKTEFDSRRSNTARVTDTLPPRTANPAAPRSTKLLFPAAKPKVQADSDSIDSFLDDDLSDKKPRGIVPKPSGRIPLSTRQSRYTRPIISHDELASNKSKDEPKATMPVEEKKSTFAYVEVVRNRDQRAALPAHDCVECRKYYEALDGLVSESEMKDKCSRHRARFEPYQTPDDFWRLSFADEMS